MFLASLLLVTSCTVNRSKNSSQILSASNKVSGVKPTRASYQLLVQNKLAEVWKGRCILGDPIGCVGFATWGNPRDVRRMHGLIYGNYWVGVGWLVRYNSSKGLLGGNPELYSSIDALIAANLSLGKAIVRTHLGTTGVDLQGKKYLLSAREITKYHHAVFDHYNVNRGWYGGSILTGRHHRLLEPLYCRPPCDNR